MLRAVTIMITSYFLVLEVPPSLRVLRFGSLGGTPSPRVRSLEVGAPQKCFVGLEPKLGVLHPKELGQNQVDFE